MGVYSLDKLVPRIAEDAYVAETACVVGAVALRGLTSVWPGAVIRGDNELISVGSRSNIQDGAVLHTDQGFPLDIGEEVTVGHGAVLHGCSVGTRSLIGVRAVILNGVRIGEESIVGAGAIVTEGKTFPPRTLLIGAPAKPIRTLTSEEVEKLVRNAEEYVQRAAVYRRALVLRQGHDTRLAPDGWRIP